MRACTGGLLAVGVPWGPSLGFSKCSPGLKLPNHRRSLKATFLVLHKQSVMQRGPPW